MVAGSDLEPSPARLPLEHAPAPWWTAFLETDDAPKRRAIFEKALKRRLRSAAEVPAKTWQKVERDVWELSWAIVKESSPLDALKQIDATLEELASRHQIELDSGDPALEAFLRSEGAALAESTWRKKLAEEKLLTWLQKDEAPASGALAAIEVEWLAHPCGSRTSCPSPHHDILSVRGSRTSCPSPHHDILSVRGSRTSCPSPHHDILSVRGSRTSCPSPHHDILSVRGALPEIAFRVFLTTEERAKAPLGEADLHALREDLRQKRVQLAAEEARLLDWMLTRGAVTNARSDGREAGEGPIPVRNAHGWLELFGKEGRIRWSDGGRCTISSEAASLKVVRREGASPIWAVAFERASSNSGAPEEPLPLDQADLLTEAEGPSGEPMVYLRRGPVLTRLDTLSMPLDLLGLLVHAPEIPIAKLRDQAEGVALARRLSASAKDGRSELARVVQVKPFVEIRLENETTYTVTAGARSLEGLELVRTHAGAWMPRSALRLDPKASRTELEPLEAIEAAEPGLEDSASIAAPIAATASLDPPHDLDAIAVIPRAEDTKGVDAWLARVIPPDAVASEHADRMPSFRWRADGAATLRLVRQWIARPSGVTYLGDGSFRRLVKVQEAPQLRVSSREAGIDWLEVSIDLEDELASLSLRDIADALEQSPDEILMVRGARLYRREHLERYLREAEALYHAGIVPGAGWQRIHKGELEGDPGTALTRIRSSSGEIFRITERASGKRSSSHAPMHAPIALGIAAYLRPYQRTGVDFIVHAAAAFGGALLADDMGLGKTLQTLSALTALRALSTGPSRPSLVICPASVAHNWRREALRFAPDLRVVVIEGGERRKSILANLSDYDLVIENFALVRRDAAVLKAQEFLLIAVDEAQAIKNPAADTTQSVKLLSATHRIALTGTPIENRLTDLWSIVDFIVPGYLGSLLAFERMAKDQEAPVMHQIVRARLRPLLLRRLKRDVTPELPERIEERLDCEMTDGQKRAYLAEVKRTRMLLEGLTKPEDLSGEKRVQMLAALTRLRQICCEPALVDLPGRSSGKVEELMQLLPELLESGHKVLLFSQFVRMLDILAERLGERSIPYRMLTGQTPDRMEVVDAFEHDPTPSVFLISLKAGGTGLNLTSASHVILYDPWWSPALEAQAIDRSHRIGQDKTVVAIRLVTKGTIEERILELQERKLGLVRDILQGGAVDRTLSAEDFLYLLSDYDEPLPDENGADMKPDTR